MSLHGPQAASVMAVPPKAPRGDNGRMTDAALRLTVNGEPRAFEAPLDIPALLVAEGLGERRVAVEVNGEIVPRGRYAADHLKESDRVEVVRAIGGG